MQRRLLDNFVVSYQLRPGGTNNYELDHTPENFQLLQIFDCCRVTKLPASRSCRRHEVTGVTKPSFRGRLSRIKKIPLADAGQCAEDRMTTLQFYYGSESARRVPADGPEDPEVSCLGAREASDRQIKPWAERSQNMWQGALTVAAGKSAAPSASEAALAPDDDVAARREPFAERATHARVLQELCRALSERNARRSVLPDASGNIMVKTPLRNFTLSCAP
jgi:hypothetical protein